MKQKSIKHCYLGIDSAKLRRSDIMVARCTKSFLSSDRNDIILFPFASFFFVWLTKKGPNKANLGFIGKKNKFYIISFNSINLFNLINLFN